MLAAALFLSIGGAVVLGLGLADPPRAGPLLWQNSTPQTWSVQANQAQRGSAFNLPELPFTIEVTARLSADSDPWSNWGVNFNSGVGSAIYGNGLYSQGGVPSQTFVEFPHLRPVGEFNRLALTVNADQSAILRLNDEIAWRGQFPLGEHKPFNVTLSVLAGLGGFAKVTWERIVIYAPTQK